MNGSVEVITKRRRALAREYFVKPGAVASVGVHARARGEFLWFL